MLLGDHQDPRHLGRHPELKGKVIVPDVLLQAHSASLGLTFYTGQQFPPAYRGSIFSYCSANLAILPKAGAAT